MSVRIPIIVATSLAVGLIVFGLYYPWRFFDSAVPFAFSGPEPWQALRGIDADAPVTLWLRLAWFAMWLVPVLATEAMIIAALRLCALLLRGIYFDSRTIRTVQWIGGLASLAGGSALICVAVEPWLMTLANAEHHLPMTFRYHSEETGLLLLGLGVFLVARVMRVAMMLNTENEEFV